MQSTTFQKGNGGTEVIYPVVLADIPKENQMANIRDGFNHGVMPPTEAEVEKALRMLPTVRSVVAGGSWPGFYFDELGLPTQPPEFFFRDGLVDPSKGDIPDQFCNMVRMDKAIELLSYMLDWLQEQEAPLKPQFRRTDGSEFLLYHTDLVEVFGAMLRHTMQKAGDVKYYYGRQRPEEVWHRAMVAYDCPNHPEFPAWHGTFAGTLYALLIYFFDLTGLHRTKQQEAPQTQYEALEQILLVFSHCRDLAGMHFAYSSRKGFDLGYEWGFKLLAEGLYNPNVETEPKKEVF